MSTGCLTVAVVVSIIVGTQRYGKGFSTARHPTFTILYAMATIRQQVLRLIYPLLRRFNRKREKGIVLVNSAMDAPRQSLYELSVSMPDGAVISLQDLAGRKILLVNTASNCGYTAQFAELQSLHS